MENYKYISIPQLANLLGISRIAVYRKVKSGQIKAQKFGRNYLINEKLIAAILGRVLKDTDKTIIEKAVKRTVSEYGEVLKRLGRE